MGFNHPACHLGLGRPLPLAARVVIEAPPGTKRIQGAVDDGHRLAKCPLDVIGSDIGWCMKCDDSRP
jgi:hypothetical protein